MIKTTLEEIVDETRGLLYKGQTQVSQEELGTETESAFTSVVTDSREVTKDSVFIAIKGEHVDGHDFVSTLPSGALAIVDHVVSDAQGLQLVVEDTVKALGDIARLNIKKRRDYARRGMNEFTIIGITGSVGKTTTKDMLSTVLGKLAATVSPVGSFNNNIGLPLTALQVDEKTRFFVAEMGASAVGEIAYLTTIARPDIAIVLKVGVAHLGGFGSVEHIRDAKAEIVRSLTSSGVAILNADDENVRSMASMTKASNIIWFSRQDAQSQPKPLVSGMISSVIVRGTDSHVDELNRPMFTVELPDGTHFDLRLGIPGEHNVYNALAVLGAIYSLDIPEHLAASALSQMSQISPHRMQIACVDADDCQFTLIDDSFNANPDSMKAGLNTLHTFQEDDDLQRIAVLGSMLELGPSEIEAHEEVGQYAADHADIVIAVGSSEDDNLMRLASSIRDGAAQQGNAQALLASDTDEAYRAVRAFAKEKKSVVLLKGSHASGLSALATKLLS